LVQSRNLYNGTGMHYSVVFSIILVFPLLVAPVLVDGAPGKKTIAGLSAAPRTVDLRDHPAWVGGRATFVLRNDSERPVTLVKVRTSCGCAKASVPEGDIAPGKGAELVVEIKANTLRGPYTKHVFVHWSSGPSKVDAGNGEGKPRTRLLRLTVRGNAKPLLTVRPGTVIALRRVPVGRLIKREMLIEAGPEKVILGEPELPPGISLQMAGKKLKPNGSMPLSLSFRTEKPGKFRCVLSIPVGSPKGHPPIGVVVHGTAVGDGGKAKR